MTDYMKNAEQESEEAKALVLSGTSPIQVKFIGWLVLVCASGFGGWIWWAAAMSTKLDVVIDNQNKQLAMVTAVTEDVSRIKEWRGQIDSVGTPAMVRRVDSIESAIRELEKAFALHIATTTDMRNQ